VWIADYQEVPQTIDDLLGGRRWRMWKLGQGAVAKGELRRDGEQEACLPGGGVYPKLHSNLS